MSYPNTPGPQPGNGASNPQQWGQPASGPNNPQPYGAPGAQPGGEPVPPYGAPGQQGQPPVYGAPGQPGQPGQPPAYGQPGPQGQPPMAPPSYPQPGMPAAGSPYSQYGGFPGTDPSRRPGMLLASCIMAWVGSAFLAIVGLFLLFAGGNSDFLDGAGLSGEATGLVRGIGGFALAYAVAVIVVAVFAFKRSKGAWIALIVLGCLYALLMLMAVVGGTTQSLVPLLWTAIAVGLLFPASKWYTQR